MSAPDPADPGSVSPAAGDCLAEEPGSESLLATAVQVQETLEIPSNFPPEPLLDPPTTVMPPAEPPVTAKDVANGHMSAVAGVIFFVEKNFTDKYGRVIKFRPGSLHEFCNQPVKLSATDKLSKEDRKRVEYWQFADPQYEEGGVRASVFCRFEKGMSFGRSLLLTDELIMHFNDYLNDESDYLAIYDKMMDRWPEACFHLWKYPDKKMNEKYQRYEPTPEQERAEAHAMGEFSSLNITLSDSQFAEFTPLQTSTQKATRTLQESQPDLFSVADGVIYHPGSASKTAGAGKPKMSANTATKSPAKSKEMGSGKRAVGGRMGGAGAGGGGSDDEGRDRKKGGPDDKVSSDDSEESSKKKGGKRPRSKKATESSETGSEASEPVGKSPKKRAKRQTKNQKLEAELQAMREKEAERREREEQREREMREMQETLRKYEKDRKRREDNAKDTVDTLKRLGKDGDEVEEATEHMRSDLSKFRRRVEADISEISKVPTRSAEERNDSEEAEGSEDTDEPEVVETEEGDDEDDPVQKIASQLESASEEEEEEEKAPTLTRTDSSTVLARASVHEPPRERTPPPTRHPTPSPSPPRRKATPIKAPGSPRKTTESAKIPERTAMPPPSKIPPLREPPKDSSSTLPAPATSRSKGKGKGKTSQPASTEPTTQYSCNPREQPCCRCESMTLEEMRADMINQPSVNALFHRLFYIQDIESRAVRRRHNDVLDTQERIVKGMKASDRERKQTFDMSKTATQAASEAARAVTQASQAAMSASQEGKDEIRAKREAMCVRDEQMLRLPFVTYAAFLEAWTDWERKEAMKRLFFSVQQKAKNFPAKIFCKFFDLQLWMRLLMPVARVKEIQGFAQPYRLGERNFPIPNDFLEALMYHMDKEFDHKDPRSAIRTHLNDMRTARNNQIKAILAKHVNNKTWNVVDKFYLLIALDDEYGWNLCRKPAPLYPSNTAEEREEYFEIYADRFISKCKAKFGRLANVYASEINVKKDKGLSTKKIIPAAPEPQDEEIPDLGE